MDQTQAAVMPTPQQMADLTRRAKALDRRVTRLESMVVQSLKRREAVDETLAAAMKEMQVYLEAEVGA